jgi:predicted ArsR family transcriptional regulator
LGIAIIQSGFWKGNYIVKFVTNNQKQSTREVIMHTNKSSPESTIETLAGAADVSPVTVRHHINSLLADGLIEASAVRRKVGRPYYIYTLSQDGQELFPKRYVRLTSRILDELKSRLPETMVAEIFKGVVQGIIADHAGEFETLPMEQKLDYLVDMLGDEGFLSSWEKTADGYKLIEYSCPYISVGHEHSEVCTFDKELMLSVLQTPIQQHSCMLEGANCCEFSLVTEN